MRQRARRPNTSGEIKKAYIIAYYSGRPKRIARKSDIEYFAGWDCDCSGHDWATVPCIAKWTRKKSEAEQQYIDTPTERQTYMKIVIGFSNTSLIPVNLEDQKEITRRQPRIWKSKKY